MSSLINFSIKNAQGGYDKYTMSVNDKQDDFGNNVSIYVQQSKEDREAKVKKNFVGNGKVSWTDGNIVKAEWVEKKESKPAVMENTSDKIQNESSGIPF